MTDVAKGSLYRLQYNFDMTEILIFAAKGNYVMWKQQILPPGMVRQIFPQDKKEQKRRSQQQNSGSWRKVEGHMVTTLKTKESSKLSWEHVFPRPC